MALNLAKPAGSSSSFRDQRGAVKMEQIRFCRSDRYLERQVEFQINVRQGSKFLLPAQRFVLIECFHDFFRNSGR
jgi:hypothetical protein